jgi:hypothetical protein
LALTGALFFRYWSKVQNPIIGIAICFVIIVITTLLVLAALPAGRLALRDVRHSVSLSLSRESESLNSSIGEIS